MMNWSVLQLVVCSGPGSGCGFVVVAVLFPRLLFVPFFFFLSSLSACSERTGRLLLTAWTRPVELSSPWPKAGRYMFGHPRCQFIRTVMPFELLLYHKLIFAFFGFAVCFSCQNRSLFLCIEFRHCNKNNNRHTHTHRIHPKISSIYSFRSFQCIQEKEGEASRSHLSLCLTNKRNFLHISPRTSSCHQTVRSLQYLYFITDGADWTLVCQAALNTGSGTDRYLWSNCVVWKKKKTYCFWNLLCPTLIVASGAQIRTLCFGLVLFSTFDYGARIEGIVTHVLLCETLYRVYYYHF